MAQDLPLKMFGTNELSALSRAAGTKPDKRLMTVSGSLLSQLSHLYVFARYSTFDQAPTSEIGMDL